MKKIVLSSLCVLAFAICGVHAEVLNWQIGGTNSQISSQTGDISYNAIRVSSATDHNTHFDLVSDNDTSLTASDGIYYVGSHTASSSDPYNFAISFDSSEYGSNSYDFYIELFNATTGTEGSYGNAIGWENVSVSDLSSYLSSSWQDAMAKGAVSASNVVPEPTSGLLLLMGGALLALRRKRA